MGVVAQFVGNTTITVEYYRPVARGRAAVFPNVVQSSCSYRKPGAPTVAC
ncbi:MAG: hypothetical protein ACJ79A_12200 [Gemmatimonadaceae bacterium]